jgi:hypothetical protein
VGLTSRRSPRGAAPSGYRRAGRRRSSVARRRREPELAVLRDFLEREVPWRRTLVLTGGPGIGKTTLWEAGIDRARDAGLRLLTARPSSAEAGLPFAALIDLCETVERGTPGIGDEIPVPDGIDDLLGARVAGLSVPVRKLLLALALGGELRMSELLAVGDRAALGAPSMPGCSCSKGTARVLRIRCWQRQRANTHAGPSGASCTSPWRAARAAPRPGGRRRRPTPAGAAPRACDPGHRPRPGERLASAERCEALLELASDTDAGEAAAKLARAATTYAELGFRFDAGGCLLTLGRSQRRFKKWGAAGLSLDQAVDAFEKMGSDGWAERARSERSRVGGRRRGSSDELTPAERRVAALASEGLSSKEIAHGCS